MGVPRHLILISHWSLQTHNPYKSQESPDTQSLSVTGVSRHVIFIIHWSLQTPNPYQSLESREGSPDSTLMENID